MHWTKRVTQAALLAAALGVGTSQAGAQERDPARSMATSRRVTPADREAAAQRAKAAREAAARKKEATPVPKAKAPRQAKPSLETSKGATP